MNTSGTETSMYNFLYISTWKKGKRVNPNLGGYFRVSFLL